MVNTINVRDIDETIVKIMKSGGKVIVRKMDVPMAGTLAYFINNDGIMFGILQPKENFQM